MNKIDFNSIVTLIGIVAVVVSLIVGLSTLLVRRDGKTEKTTKVETSLTGISLGLNELRLDLRTGFRDMDKRMSSFESSLGELKGRVDIIEKAIERAHTRIDDIGK